jgi:DNA-directed RNA polymerase specialized sigma24 family protein
MTFENYIEKHNKLITTIVGRFGETSLTGHDDYRQVALVKLWYLFHTKQNAEKAYIAACLFRAVAKFKKVANRKTPPIRRKEEVYDEIQIWEILPHLTDGETAVLNCALGGLSLKETRRELKMQYGELKTLKNSLKEKMAHG